MKLDIFKLYFELFNKMTPYFQRKSILVVLSSILESIFEILSIALFIPLLSIIFSEPSNSISVTITRLFGIDSELELLITSFLLFLAAIMIKNVLVFLLNLFQSRFLTELTTTTIATAFTRAVDGKVTWESFENSEQAIHDIYHNPRLFNISLVINLMLFLSELFILIFIMGALIAYDFSVFISLLLVVGPILLFFTRSIRRRVEYYDNRIKELIPTMFQRINEAFFGSIDIILTSSQSFFVKGFKKNIAEEAFLHGRKFVVNQLPKRVIEFSVLLSAMILVLVNYLRTYNRESIIMTLAVFGTASFKAIPSLNRVLSGIINIRALKFTNDYIFFDDNFSFQTKKDIDAIHLNKKVEFQSVSFSYGDKSVFKDLNLTIDKGQIIGIKGESGVGKSTLIKLLLGLKLPTSGGIYVDESKLGNTNISNWQKSVGYVSQDVFLWNDTLKANIALGQVDIDQERMDEVIDQVALRDYVQSLPEGLDSIVGERGSNMSGGQKQRLGIARTLYSRSEVLLLDEITSSLDNETELKVYDVINNLRSKKTIILVSHRDNLEKVCDKLYLLDHSGFNLLFDKTQSTSKS